ncbi:MAG: sulfatase [Planctomycetaceae bacterium]|nr:sulfatase [Planctomycetaceae bacterium]
MPLHLPRRDFLTASVAASLTPQLSAAPQTTNSRPNVLFILTDQWRFSAFGHSTDQVVRTPNIDRLGAEGTICTRAYACNPVCTPNRSCLLTGRYSHQTGMIQNNLMLPPSEVCWPQLLASAGYDTHYIGKWHLDGQAKPGYVPPGWRRRGFRTFQGFNRGHIYHKPWGFEDDGAELVPKEVAEAPDYYEPTFQTELAIRYMSQKRDQPFACCLSLGPPHTPFTPPKKFNLYTREQIQLRPNVPAQHEATARRDLAGYYGLCESLDHEVGRLMTFLSESELAGNTLVIFTSDHGELAGSHGKYRKGEPEEESLHVPLIFRLPGRIPAAHETATLVNSIDVMPTMLSLCGIEPPKTCSGRDVSRVIAGEQPRQDSAIYCEGKLSGSNDEEDAKPRRTSGAKGRVVAPESSPSWRTIVTDRWKLTVRHGERNVEHLFDLNEDPFEQHNLVTSDRHKSTITDLTEQLLAIRDATGDSWPRTPKSAASMYEG